MQRFTNILLNKTKHLDQGSYLFNNIFDIIRKKNISYITKIQEGGGLKKIKIDDTEYTYNIEQYKDEDRLNILLLELNNNEKECGMIIIDNNTQSAIIQDVINNKHCISCNNKNKLYKTGDILIKIMLEIIKKYKIKKIELDDNSHYKYYGITIWLNKMRTLIQGEPFYAKYGFVPSNKYDKETYEYNKKIYNNKPRISKTYINHLINYFIKNMNISKESLNQIYSIINIKDDDISVKRYISNIIKLSKELKDTDKNKELLCLYFNKIYEKIYKDVEYKDYNTSSWYKKLIK